jgi:hypothetical protein
LSGAVPAARERGESVAAAIAPAPATNALRRDADGLFSSIVELILFSVSEECGGFTALRGKIDPINPMHCPCACPWRSRRPRGCGRRQI